MRIEEKLIKDREKKEMTQELYNDIKNIIIKSNSFLLFKQQVKETDLIENVITDTILYVWSNFNIDKDVKLITYIYIVLSGRIKQSLRDIKADKRKINYIKKEDITEYSNSISYIDNTNTAEIEFYINTIIDIIKYRYVDVINWDNDYTNYIKGILKGYKKADILEEFNLTESKYNTIIKNFKKKGIGYFKETLNIF